ncbi:hypothetical protein V5O48_015049, partial [Marasmius crinis-equi]
ALDTLSMAFFAHSGYTYLVTFFANPLGALSIVWFVIALLKRFVVTPANATVVKKWLLTGRPYGFSEHEYYDDQMVAVLTIFDDQGIIAFIVHLFLAYRIRQLIRAPLWSAIAWIVVALAIIVLAFGVYSCWALNKTEVIIALNGAPSLRWMIITATSSSSALDLFIALIICYQLYQERSKVNSTRGLVNTISLYMISSGMITTLFNMGALISYLASNTEIDQIFNSLIPRAYVNTLMATLNMREVIRSRNAPGVISDGFSGIGNIQFNPSGSETGSIGSLQAAVRSQHESEYDIPLAEPKARMIEVQSEP